MSYDDMVEKQNTAGMGMAIRNRELIPNLKAQRHELTARIEKIDQLLGILEKNPDFIRMFDLTRELM